MSQQNFQSKVYECSASSASVKIANNHWINEFPDGIHLDVDDTVRVLGSFIQEKGGGDTIEIEEDLSLMVKVYPYITAETIRLRTAINTQDYQISLGDIAMPAAMTDNIGIEPPWVNPYQASKPPVLLPSVGSSANVPGSRIGGRNPGFPTALSDFVGCKDKPMSTKAIGQQESNQLYGGVGFGGFNGQGETVVVSGWEDAGAGMEGLPNGYVNSGGTGGSIEENFYKQNIPREFYISSLCKLVRFPLFNQIRCRYGNTSNLPDSIKIFKGEYTLDPSRPFETPFMAGDLLASYYISGFSDYNSTGILEAATETLGQKNTFGVPRYSQGPRSVIGKVLASRYNGRTIPHQETEMYIDGEETQVNGDLEVAFCECYIWDFVNPAAVKPRQANTPVNPPQTNRRHGSTTVENGYSQYPSNNNLNGTNFQELFKQEIVSGNNPRSQQHPRACQSKIVIPNMGDTSDAGLNNSKLWYQEKMDAAGDAAWLQFSTGNSSLCFLSSGGPTAYNARFGGIDHRTPI